MLEVFSLDFSVGDASCRLVTVNPSNRADPHMGRHFQHSHSGCEIHYVSAGTLSIDCIDAGYQLSAGQVLVIPSGVYHYVRSVSENIDRMDMLMEINRVHRCRDAQLSSFLQGLLLTQPLLLREEENRELFALLRKLRQTAMDRQQREFLRREWMKAMCAELVLLLGAAAENRTDTATTAFDSTQVGTDRYIMDQFFNHNYHGNSDMADLAKELNLSVRQTGRVLQKTYGKSFREKMNECRLAVALDMLRNTAKPMAEISELLGYGEPTNFSSFVKRQTGKTPAQIRKEV